MAFWTDKARALRDEGLTYEQIAEAVGRTRARVFQVLNKVPSRPNRGNPAHDDTELTKQRRTIRRRCRAIARQTGERVEDVYARNGVSTIDRSVHWEHRGWKAAA